jgi:hypothetical protein
MFPVDAATEADGETERLAVLVVGASLAGLALAGVCRW